MFTSKANDIFDRVTADYHLRDDVDFLPENPFAEGSVEALLYHKCWIDAVQWHLEDIIRNPDIDPAEGMLIKRRIDSSNQRRTDMVEYLDGWFMQNYPPVGSGAGAKLNTETPAWAIDRLSILALKIFHMRAEALREDVGQEHRDACRAKYEVLLTQREDLSTAIEELLEDLSSGRKRMKFYKQMKMYNDPALNPVLYKKS